MWTIELDGKKVFEDSCQRVCLKYLADNDFFKEDGFKVTFTTDRKAMKMVICRFKEEPQQKRS